MNIVYNSFATSRREEYKVVTQIIDNDGLFVRKTAVGLKAEEHIKQIARNYELLSEKLPDSVHICGCELHDNYIDFEYIQGANFAEEILKEYSLCGIEGAEKKFIEYRDLIAHCSHKCEAFEYNELFKKVFGVIDFVDEECIYPGNVDFLPQNIICSDGRYNIIDYEWVYDMPIPMEYILWRAVHHYYLAIDLGHMSDMDKMLDKLGFTNVRKALYECMERNFLNYVYDAYGMSNVMTRYLKEKNDIRDIHALNEKVAELEKSVSLYADSVNEYESRCCEYECRCREYKSRCREYESRCREYEVRCVNYINEVESWKQEYAKLQNMSVKGHIKQILKRMLKRKK